MAFLLEDIAVLATLLGQSEVAFELLGAADSLREAIGAPRPPALVAELAEHVAPAEEALGARQVAAARQLGSTLSIQEAIESGLRFTRRHGSEK